MAEQPLHPIHGATGDVLARAARHLTEGKLVAFPTETVYGLGADATSANAIAALYAIKGRPTHNPLIVHVAEPADIWELVEVTPIAASLMAAFWPGPMTLVLDKKAGSQIVPAVSAGLSKLAIRCPSHPIARELIRLAGLPIAAPSANRSGEVSPTRAEHVLESLGQDPEMIIDAGPCADGIESTVVDATGDHPLILRPGVITREMIEHELRLEPAAPDDVTADADRPMTSPGMMTSHYAPRLPVVLNQTRVGPDDAVLAFAGVPSANGVGRIDMSPKGSFAQAACHLYDALRMLDRIGIARRIVVGPVPERELGVAINDRLRRSAAPRDDDTAR